MNRMLLTVTLALLTGVGTGVGLVATVPSAQAQPARALPTDCSPGMLVVAQRDGRFGCVEPSKALALTSCREGDFITVNAFGDLRCQGIALSGGSTKALLPSCSSGQVLRSDGGGSWRCVSAATSVPGCSSGQFLQSEGGGSWRCVSSPSALPSCSSGQILVAESSSSWRCGDAKR